MFVEWKTYYYQCKASCRLWFTNAIVYIRACAVISRRKWMDVFAHGGPVWPEGYDTALPPREHNRDALYDIYEVSPAALLR